jgi:type II secretory pathway predicted ATPase ExeA
MDSLLNPYTPGAGMPPRELAGRAAELRHFELLLDRLAAGRAERGLVLHGLHGAGKTVLMRELAERAVERGWGVGRLEATSATDLRAALGEMGAGALRQISPRARERETLLRAARFVGGFTQNVAGDGAGFSADLEVALAELDGSDLERDAISLFAELGTAAASNGTGIALMIDEMHSLGREDLGALCAAAHRAGQDRLPIALVGAGLPTLPQRLPDAKPYAERLFDFTALGPLDTDAAAQAIRRPAETAIAGRPVRCEDAAVELILERSQRHPYFLQAYGLEAWNVAPEGDRIRAGDVKRASALVHDALDRDFFEARFGRATAAGRRYLVAMAGLGEGPYGSGQVAERGGWRSVTSAAPVRQSLVERGLIYGPDHGRVEFTAPRFADFMRRRRESD